MVVKILILALSLIGTSLAYTLPSSSQNSGSNVTFLECIDTLDDFRSKGWRTGGDGYFQYANTSADLPGNLNVVLKDLDGQGIFTIEGAGYEYSFWRDVRDLDRSQPTYFYAKFYAIRRSEWSFIYLVPVINPDDHPNHSFIRVLELPEEVVWGEGMAEMDLNNPWISEPDVSLAIYNLHGGEFLIAEKLILVQGQHFNDTKEVAALCGW